MSDPPADPAPPPSALHAGDELRAPEPPAIDAEPSRHWPGELAALPPLRSTLRRLPLLAGMTALFAAGVAAGPLSEGLVRLRVPALAIAVVSLAMFVWIMALTAAYVRLGLRVARGEPARLADLLPGRGFVASLTAVALVSAARDLIAYTTLMRMNISGPDDLAIVGYGFFAVACYVTALSAVALAIDRGLPPLAALAGAWQLVTSIGWWGLSWRLVACGLFGAAALLVMMIGVTVTASAAGADPEASDGELIVAALLVVWAAVVPVVWAVLAARLYARVSDEAVAAARPRETVVTIGPRDAVASSGGWALPLLLAPQLALFAFLQSGPAHGAFLPAMSGGPTRAAASMTAFGLPLLAALVLQARAESRARGVVVDAGGLVLGPWTERWPGRRVPWADLLGWRVVEDGVRLHLRGRPERLGPVVHADEAEVLALVAALERGKA